MVARGPGAVGCAHCRALGATRPCLVCRKLVCDNCDFATCEEPAGRSFALGFTARLRDVDPAGRLGLVSHWRRAPRLIDLRRLRWIEDTNLPRRMRGSWDSCPPRLMVDGRVVYRDTVHQPDGYYYTYLRACTPAGETSRLPDVSEPHAAGMTAIGDRYWVVTGTQRVAVMREVDAGWEVHEHEPLPRKVIHAAYVDGERDLLASGSWGEVALHRMVGDQLEPLGYSKTEHPGNVTWIAVAGSWLVLVTNDYYLEVRRLASDLTLREVAYRRAGAFHLASLSRDGRFLALATPEGLAVRELDTGAVSVFDDHRRPISLARFVGDDHVLVTADLANRVVLRPRCNAGYEQPLVAIEIP